MPASASQRLRQQRVDEGFGVEHAQVFRALADAGVADGNAELAQSHGFEIEHADTQLIAKLAPGAEPRAATAALNRALCAADIAIHALTPRRRSLETLYRQAAQPEPAAA